MEKKIVQYNGGIMSLYECTKPTDLVVGKEYEVSDQRERESQTDYALNGINGFFDSDWFDEPKSKEEPTFIALAHNIPLVGARCRCSKIEISKGVPKLVDWTTDTVKDICYISGNIYRVTTRNSIYLVLVG